jgi:hypothetical protein
MCASMPPAPCPPLSLSLISLFSPHSASTYNPVCGSLSEPPPPIGRRAPPRATRTQTRAHVHRHPTSRPPALGAPRFMSQPYVLQVARPTIRSDLFISLSQCSGPVMERKEERQRTEKNQRQIHQMRGSPSFRSAAFRFGLLGTRTPKVIIIRLSGLI